MPRIGGRLAPTTPASSVPTNVTIDNSEVNEDATAGFDVGTLAVVGGVAPYTFTQGSPTNTKFQFNPSSGVTTILERSASGTIVGGVPETVYVIATDSNGQASPSIPIIITVLSVSAPSDVTLSANSIFDNAVAGTVVGDLGSVGGVAPIVFTVTVNADFDISVSGTQLVRSATSGPLVVGNVSVTVRATDANAHHFDKAFTVAVVDHSAQTVLTTFKWYNTSGGTAAAGTATNVFGHPFKDGEIAPGTYPNFYLHGTGTKLLMSMSAAPTYYDSGCMRHASFALLTPSSVGNGNFIEIDIVNNGIAPTPSVLTLANVSARNFKCEFDPLTGMQSGTSTASLNTAISSGDFSPAVFMNGEAGIFWIMQGNATPGPNSGFLKVRWYVFAIQNSSGGLYGFRILPRVIRHGFYNTSTSATVICGFTDIRFMDGASLICDPWTATLGTKSIAKATPLNFTWRINGNKGTGIGQAYFATTGFPGYGARRGGFLIRFTTTGTLPAGLSPNTDYWTREAVNAPAPEDPDHQFSVMTDCPLPNGSYVQNSDAGSGTHTMTFYPGATIFAGFYFATPDGHYPYAQGGGSVAAEVKSYFRFDPVYWRSTGNLLPLSFVTAAGAPLTVVSTTGDYFFLPNGAVNDLLEQGLGTPGERHDIGSMPTWYTRHAANQNEVDDHVVRMCALCESSFSMALRNSTTGTIPNLGNPSATYTGMPASEAVPLRYNLDTTAGMLIPSDALMMTFARIDTDHMPQLSPYPFLVLGEPHLLDTLVEKASSAILQRVPGATTSNVSTPNRISIGTNPPRNFKVAGVDYYGSVAGSSNQIRTDAWALNTVAWAAALLPQNHWECAAYKQYFTDRVNTSCSVISDWFENVVTNSFMHSSGRYNWHWNEQATTTYMEEYFWNVVCQVVGFGLGGAAAVNLVENAVKWTEARFNNANGGAYQLTAFIYPFRDSALVFTTSIDQYAAQLGSAKWTWAAGSPGVVTFSDRDSGRGYVLSNGDKMVFTAQYGLPGGLVDSTPYWVYNASGSIVGSTFNLSSTPPGVNTPVTVSDTVTTGKTVYSVPVIQPTNALGAGGIDPQSYLSEIYGVMCHAQARGFAVDPAMLAALLLLGNNTGMTALVGTTNKYWYVTSI